MDVFLLEPSDFRFSLTRKEVETWDSLGIVAMAVGVHETFGYHFTPVEAMDIRLYALWPTWGVFPFP